MPVSICGWWTELYFGLRQWWISRQAPGLCFMWQRPISHILYFSEWVMYSFMSAYFSTIMPIQDLLLHRMYVQKYAISNKILEPANPLKQEKVSIIYTLVWWWIGPYGALLAYYCWKCRGNTYDNLHDIFLCSVRWLSIWSRPPLEYNVAQYCSGFQYHPTLSWRCRLCRSVTIFNALATAME